MMGNTENSNVVAWSDDKDKLRQWYESQKVEPYADDGVSPLSGSATKWHKSFAKGGPLEWYNPVEWVNEGQEINSYDHGVHFEWFNEEDIEKINVGYRVQ